MEEKMMIRVLRLLSLIAGFAILSATGLGQETTGNLEGQVKDTAGGLVPNA